MSAKKSKSKVNRRLKLTAVGFAVLTFGAYKGQAQTLYFDGTGANNATQTGTWSTSTNVIDWNPAADGSGTSTYWTNGDVARFSVSGATTATTTSTVTLGTAVSASALYFDTGATTITGAFAITVGSGGITVASGASGSIGNASGNSSVTTTVSETWTNNSATTLIVGGGSIGGGTTQGTGLILDGGNIELGNTGQNNTIGGTGSVTVDAGTLTIGGAGSALSAHNVYLTAGSTIATVAGKNASGLNLFMEGNFASSIGGSNAFPIASLTLDGNYTLTANAGSNTIVNVIKNGTSGTTLTIAGPSSGTAIGTVSLNGTSTFTGTTVTVGALSALSFGAGNAGGDISNGSGTGFTGGTIQDSGFVQFNHSGAYTFNGHITGTGGISNYAGVNTIADATNNNTGVTTAFGGTLSVATLTNGGVASPIGAATNVAANIVLNGGALQYTGSGGSTDRLFTIGSTYAGTLDASGTGAINFTNTGSIGTQNHGETLTLTGSSTANNTLAAKIAGGNAGAATIVAKTGAGTWILTNANTYAGATNISGGTLLVNGTHTGGGAYNVTALATLGGGGTINTGSNAINIGNGTTGGMITGGAVGAVGMLTLTTTNASGVIFNGASGSLSTYAVDLTSTTSDNLKINGALTLTGGFDHIVVTGTTGASSYDLINYTGTSLTGGFTEAAGDLPTGYTLAYNTDEIDLVATAVPEPSTWMAGILSLGILGFQINKRRRATRVNGVTV